MRTRTKAVVALVLGAYAGCAADKTGGETHWLGACGTDRDCGTAQCLCGVCTRTCSGDGDCGGSRSAQCYAVASPGLASRCSSSMPKGNGVCLAACENDADCPAGDQCLLGACVASIAPATPEKKDAGPPPGEIAKRYVNRDAGVTFGEPPEAPEPSPFIDGPGAEALVGVWEQVGPDGGPCDVPYTLGVFTIASCMRLEIVKDASDAITAKVSYSGLPPADYAGLTPGPFPPATDPDHGYPAGIDPRVYTGVVLDGGPPPSRMGLNDFFYPGLKWTVLDGHADGHGLTFWLSKNEVWKDWCALQTPYPFELDGMHGYRCVPQDATRSNTDLGKYILCTNLKDDGFCQLPPADPRLPPNWVPCASLRDASSNPRSNLNGLGVCSCTASRCRASNARGGGNTYSFEVTGNTLRGNGLPPSIELRRVTP